MSVAALADDSDQARVAINANFTPASPPVDNIVQHPGYCEASGSGWGGFSSSGQAHARVNYGWAVLSGDSYGSLSSQAWGIFRDSVTFTAPGIATGTPGTVVFTVTVSGSVASGSGSSAASWHVAGDIGGGATDMSHSAMMYSPSLHNPQYVGDAFGTFTAVGSFQYGFAAPLYIELYGGAGTGYDSNGPGSASFQNLVLNWGGLSNATANGQPVSGWSVSSESGTNWGGALTAPPVCPADFGGQGGAPTPDGQLDNNDFVVFIDYFFNHNPLADIGIQGGVPGHDGVWDNNDFVVFIDEFFMGC
jgi:hypothetical protein